MTASPRGASLTGGCLCGAVRYSVDAEVSALRACHCRNCQKHTGTGGSVNAVVPSAAFRITQGTPKKYDDSATQSGRTLSRHFCGECGSPIFGQRNPDPGFLVVRAGTLDDTSRMQIASHIWTATAPAWMHVDRSLECHPGNMPPPPAKS